MAQKLTLDVRMVSHDEVSVFVVETKDQRAYPTVELFLEWLNEVRLRCLERNIELVITTSRPLHAHPADLMLRERIGESSAGPYLG